MHLRAALEHAGIETLNPAARQWLEGRIARFGLDETLNNAGGLKCTLRHNHAKGPCAPLFEGVPGTRCLGKIAGYKAAFRTVEEGAAALVASARRSTARGDIPADTLEGFRSTHPVLTELAGVEEDEREAAHVRAMLADWHAFERMGIRNDPNLKIAVEGWSHFRDEWLAGNGGDVESASLLTDRVRELAGIIYTDAQKTRVEWLNKQYNDLNASYMGMSGRTAEFTSMKLNWTQLFMKWKQWKAIWDEALFGGPDDAQIAVWENKYNEFLTALDATKKVKTDERAYEAGRRAEEQARDPSGILPPPPPPVVIERPAGAQLIDNPISSATPPKPPESSASDTFKVVAISAAAGAAILVITSLALRLVSPV